MQLIDILEILEARSLNNDDEALETDVSQVFASSRLSDVLVFAPVGAVLLTTLTQRQVVRTAEMAELSGICFVENRQPAEAAVELAGQLELPLMVTRYDIPEICRRLNEKGVDCTVGRAQ